MGSPHRYIPKNADAEIKKAFMRVWEEVEKFSLPTDVDLKGRRFVNSDEAEDSTGLITLSQLQTALGHKFNVIEGPINPEGIDGVAGDAGAAGAAGAAGSPGASGSVFDVLTYPDYYWGFEDVDYWSEQAGTGVAKTNIAGEDDHPGIAEYPTGTNSAAEIAQAWIPVHPVGIWQWARIDKCSFIFKFPTAVTTMRMEVGLSGDASAGWPTMAFEADNDMFYLWYDTNTDTKLKARIRAGGSTTHDIELESALQADKWYRFDLKRTDTGMEFWLDGVLRYHAQTSLPATTEAMGAFFRIGNRAAVNRRIWVDCFAIRHQRVEQQWD